MADRYKIPRGTFDILPEESYKWQYVKNVFHQIAQAYNYREIVTPIFEVSQLFERTVGDSSDIVQKEMYKFQDKKGRTFALRPEGTASVVRSYVENNLHMNNYGDRLFYMGPMFRYDRPQKGRYRQFYQYGVEYFGSQNAYVDAEVIALAYQFLKTLGLNNFQLEINSIGCPNCSKDYDKALVDFFTPHLGELCQDCNNRIKKNPKRLLDCKIPTCKAIAANAPSMLDYLDEECQQDFDSLQKYLTDLEIPFTINPRIVRGLDYYRKTAFEFINNNLGAQNALCGGGRYDGLVKQLGGKDVPAIGFAGGFERLILSMENEGLSFGEIPKPKYFFVMLGNDAKEVGLPLLNKIRVQNIVADAAPDKASLKAQMKAANKSGAPFTLILGDEELKKNIIFLKDMETGDQKEIALDNILEQLDSIK